MLYPTKEIEMHKSFWRCPIAFGGAVFLAFAAVSPRAQSAEMGPAERATLTRVIQASGFNCPSVNLATGRGPVPEGWTIRAYCGPVGTTGVFQNLVYQVIVREGAAAPIVRPGRGP
jgi:hypothetical protein